MLSLRIFISFFIYSKVLLDEIDRKQNAGDINECYKFCTDRNILESQSKQIVSTYPYFNGYVNERNKILQEEQCKNMCNVVQSREVGRSLHNQNDVWIHFKSKRSLDHLSMRKFETPISPPLSNWTHHWCLVHLKSKCTEECKPSQTCRYSINHCISTGTVEIECLYSRDPSVGVSLHNITRNNVCRQKLYFSCTSDEITYAGSTALFKFYWYIDGIVTYVSSIVYKKDIENTYLNEVNGFSKLGVKVSCEYSTHKSYDDSGTLSPKSGNFYAGIKILNTPITVQRAKRAAIRFQLTVPVGCDCSTGDPSRLTVEMRSPDSAKCDGINAQMECGLRILSTDWTKTHSIAVKHSDNGKYFLSFGPMRRVQLRTLTHLSHNIWSNVILPEISIRIVDEANEWQGKVCYSHSDPHMMTFDRRSFDNHNPGTYIMYESDDGMGNIMQVQTKLIECNKRSGPGIMCNCAVAVRAAADVYIINRCAGDEEEFGFKNCVDNVLDVRKENEKNYVIYFPTGTHVHLKLWTFQTEMVIEVDIFPSMFDKENSRGLCSTLGSGKLLGPDETEYPLTRRPDAFSKSWLVPSKSNLLDLTNFENFERMKGSVSICTCKKEWNKTEFDNGAFVHCGKSSECPRPDTPVDSSNCVVREKRSVESLFNYVPQLPRRFKKNLREKRFSLLVANKTVISEEEARKLCEESFKSSLGFQACSELPALHPEKAIEDCVLDIQLTNTTAWASASLEGFKTICMKELKQNNTLQDGNGGNASIAAKIRNVLCSNECSGHGICTNGKCLCDENFGASDCSEDLRNPPPVYIVNSESGGLCDDADCLVAEVNGDRFLDGGNLSCKFTRFQTSYTNNKVFFESTTTSATHSTLVDIRCGVPDDRRNRTTFTSADRFVTGYMVSVSNNGINFGSVSPIYILDSTCQDTVNINGQLGFILKENFCFIRGRCILNGTEEGPYNCSLCDPEINAFDWTIQYEKNECPRPRFPTNIGRIILLICFTGILVICVLITTLLVMKLKQRRRIAVASIFHQPPPYTDAPKPKFHLELKHYSVSEA